MPDREDPPAFHSGRPTSTSLAQALRLRPTDAEQRLWRRLRGRQLGARFRRQHPIAGYIVDFYCVPANLVVEVDGAQHGEPEGVERDARRDAALRRLGFRVARFTNRQVLMETEMVMDEVRLLIGEWLGGVEGKGAG